MVVRKIVHIDEDKCNGCGLCVPACHEGAIQIIDGKARVIDDKFCDGLGDCIGECPQGAISIIEREAAEYDEEAVKERMARLQREENRETAHHKRAHHNGKGHHHVGCPGSRMMDLRNTEKEEEKGKQKSNVAKSGISFSSEDIELKIKSQLKQWPVQLMLVPEKAPYFEGADLLITADCVPFAYPDYHLDLLKGKSVVVGCPKLDDNSYYIDKLTAIFRENDLRSITVAFMEVPCCSGLVRAAEIALFQSGKDIPLNKVKIGIKGDKQAL